MAARCVLADILCFRYSHSRPASPPRGRGPSSSTCERKMKTVLRHTALLAMWLSCETESLSWGAATRWTTTTTCEELLGRQLGSGGAAAVATFELIKERVYNKGCTMKGVQ
eukprot:1118305-Pyramimonas_sp.AAC.2